MNAELSQIVERVMLMILSINLGQYETNTFILKCFLQFTCTNLDGSQKKGVAFKICFRKRGYPERGGGFPQKREGSSLRKGGVPTLQETMAYQNVQI